MPCRNSSASCVLLAERSVKESAAAKFWGDYTPTYCKEYIEYTTYYRGTHLAVHTASLWNAKSALNLYGRQNFGWAFANYISVCRQTSVTDLYRQVHAVL